MKPQELEAAILSGLLYGGSTPDALEVIATLPEEAFSIRIYRSAYAEIKKQALTKGMIDVLFVSEALGGSSLATLSEIVRMPGNVANLKGYAAHARKTWYSRTMTALFQTAADGIRGANNQEQRDQVIQGAVTQLIDMTADSGGIIPVHLNDLLPGYMDMLDKRMNGEIESMNLQSGIVELDAITGGFNPQDLVVIAGRPGMGKTEFALKIVEGATQNGGGALIFSMEMASLQMVERSVAGAGNLPVSKLRDPKTLCDEDWARINSALQALNGRDIWIVDASELTIDQIRAIAETHKRRYPKLRMVMVDYLGLITKPKAERNDLSVGIISRGLKTLAGRINTPIFALSQLSRKVDERPPGSRRPISSDLRDSGSIEQDADSIIMLYREAVYNTDSPAARFAEAIVTKNRFGEPGTVYQEFKNGHFLPVDQLVAKEASRMAKEASRPPAKEKHYSTPKF
ncbi:replicative DNA helicase [Yersinia aldovae]|uniref:replicative DNA helicase n=1 Tax=Yersinia aldovae TaxID=29483 RepID=UPI0011AAD9A5|nr:replicative DNA helicase [Yersinia aldovae]